jgi:hypothetical protein
MWQRAPHTVGLADFQGMDIMNTIKSINTRAKRIVSKATALGFRKGDQPMVIDQAREIIAAEEGHRNWHAFQASLGNETEQVEGCGSLIRSDKGYELPSGQTEAWIKIGNLSVYVCRTDVGVSASIYPAGKEDGDYLGETYANFTDGDVVGDDPGWAIFDSSGELQIQRCDEARIFATDFDAWAHVIHEALANADSAEAKALARIKHESPGEWERICAHDATQGNQLGRFLTGFAGHPVSHDEVAEWVGLHYQVNFDASGDRKQGWIDRFVSAHADDPRFGYYLVAENWGHIFRGKREDIVRWVFRLGSDDEGVVFAQIKDGHRGWAALDRAAMADLEESIYDNNVPDTYRTAWSTEVTPMTALPDWASA